MRLSLICGLPLLAAAGVLVLPAFRGRRVPGVLLAAVAASHLALVASLWIAPAQPELNGWLAVDPLGIVVLSLTSVLFLVTVVYAVAYVRRAPPAAVGCLPVDCSPSSPPRRWCRWPIISP